MARLKAPRAEQVLGIVAVVIPVDIPMQIVMLPHQPIGLGSLALGHVLRQHQCTIEITLLAAGLVRSNHRLAHMHVGVLTAVAGEVELRVGFVAIQAEACFPEVFFQQLPGFVHPLTRLIDAGFQAARIRQQHKGNAVAVIHVVFDHAIAQRPRVTPGLRVAMHVAQIVQPVTYRLQVRSIAELAVGHRVVEDEARTADQVPMPGIVDRTVIAEILEKPTGRIDRARMIERHGVGDVLAQDVGRTEIGCGCCRQTAHDCSWIKEWTSSMLGIAANAPLRVTASAPTAAANRITSLITAGSPHSCSSDAARVAS